MSSPAASGSPLASFDVPRFVWANTTVRSPAEFLSRALVLAENAPAITVARFPTAEAWQAEVGRLFAVAENKADPVNAHVVSKVLLAAQRWGLVGKVDQPGQGQWLSVYPAAQALLTDPDPTAMLASLLLADPFSAAQPHRYNVGLLQFLAACADAGLEAVRCDWVGYFMAPHAKEGPWTREVARLRKHHDTGNTAIATTAWEKLNPAHADLRAMVNAAIDDLMATGAASGAEVVAAVHADRRRLLPGSRHSRAETLATAITDAVLAGDADAVRDAVFTDLFTTKIESQCDLVRTALRYLCAAELAEELSDARAAGATTFRITAFGREALATLPPRPAGHGAAKHAQRALVHSPFTERSQRHHTRRAQLLAADRSPLARASLAATLDWDAYAGKRQAHLFEWQVVRAVFALTAPAPDHDPTAGIRTRLGHDLQPLHHAPGGGADGWTQLAARRLLVEVTGEAGPSQIGHELEPVLRHTRDAATHGPTATILVAPAFDLDLVAFLLTAAAGDPVDAVAPAIVIPLTTAQLQRLLLAPGADAGPGMEHFIAAVVDEVCLRATTPHRASARQLLAAVDAHVDAFAVNAGALALAAAS